MPHERVQTSTTRASGRGTGAVAPTMSASVRLNEGVGKPRKPGYSGRWSRKRRLRARSASGRRRGERAGDDEPDLAEVVLVEARASSRAGVPSRTPEATIGGRGSNGTVLRLTVIPTSCSRSSASLPSTRSRAGRAGSEVDVGAARQHVEPAGESSSASASAFVADLRW